VFNTAAWYCLYRAAVLL